MDQNTLTIIIVLAACAVIAGFAWLRLYLTKKKIDGDATAGKVEHYADVAEAFAESIAPFLPTNMSKIILPLAKATYSAVSVMEELWSASVLPADQRKSTATTLIQADLKKAGIPITDETNKWISVCVDMMCRFLPKSHTAPADVPTDVPVEQLTPKVTNDAAPAVIPTVVVPDATIAAPTAEKVTVYAATAASSAIAK